MKTIQYFAYGSNLCAAQMRRRCPTASKIARAVLPGYRLAFGGHSSAWGGGVATVVRDRGSVVEGMLYRMPKDELEILDLYEGTYNRRRCQLIDEYGRKRRAYIYIMPIERTDGCPAPGYHAVLRHAYDKLGFDQTSLARAAGDAR